MLHAARSESANSQPQSKTWSSNTTIQDPVDSTAISDTQSTMLHAIESGASEQPPSPVMSTVPTRTTTEECSTTKTSGSSYLLASSLYPSVFASSIAGEDKQDNLRPETPPKSIRRRPCISDFQRCESAPELPHQALKRNKDTLRKKRIERRAQSANPSVRDPAKFTSPDRYTAPRSYLDSSSSPLRTGRHPSLLEIDERLCRHRADNVDVFRATNDSGRGRPSTRPTPNALRSFQPPHFTPSFVRTLQRAVERGQNNNGTDSIVRRPSTSSIWRLGGWSPVPGQLRGVDLGNGAVTASGTNAPMIDSNFFQRDAPDTSAKRHELILAFALDIDLAQRVLPVTEPQKRVENDEVVNKVRYLWSNSSWIQDSKSKCVMTPKASILRPEKVVPTIAFRVLDAPRLKDDYYCSILAYCQGFRTLAVALTHRVYLWTERHGVRYPPLAPVRQTNYVSSLAFSSDEGGKAILATSRNSGSVTLWSLLEQRPRFELSHSSAACSTAFKPFTTKRISTRDRSTVNCEDLLVGDDAGHIYYYSVEWPDYLSGSITLLAKIDAHSQNVCGLVWAPNGESFVSGGNDNCALFFDREDIVGRNRRYGSTASASSEGITWESPRPADTEETPPIGQHQQNTQQIDIDVDPERGRNSDRDGSRSSERLATPPSSSEFDAVNHHVDPTHNGMANIHKWSFYHSAAVKAIAFAPWQPSLLATGGGSNDRQIHFHHTGTGTTLAVINVYAQVTSLAWSSTRREIVATFGYAQPEHDVRIAVFAWPSCDCVVSIPWERKPNGDIGRALWAIPYPGGPNDAAPERLHEPNGLHDLWQSQRNGHADLSPERHRLPPTPPASPERHADSAQQTRIRNFTRGEGETWASRTEEEGSLIVACCDQTVKFFEVWAGKSKGKSRGLGSKAGVLGGSRVLEGWCEDMAIEEVGAGEDVIQ